MQLATMRRSSMLVRPGDTDGPQGPTSKAHRTRRRAVDKDPKRLKRPAFLQSLENLTRLAPTSAKKGTKDFATTKNGVEEEEVRSLFQYRQSLAEKSRNRDKDLKSEWMNVTKSLLENFRNNKVFYPVDRHHRFYGYSKEARSMSLRPKHESEAMLGRPDSILGTEIEDMSRM